MNAPTSLNAIATRLRTLYVELLSGRIAMGRPTTWEYRRWCDARNVRHVGGVFLVNHPEPFPFRFPVACDACGHLAEAEDLSSEDYLVRTFNGRASRYEDQLPDEYDTRCPDCGAREVFQTAVICAVCLERPCCCTWKMLQEDRGDEKPC